MIEFSVFPGGKKRIVTFSYDDGPAQDRRLVELFNKYGVKGTFHLNGQDHIGIGEERRQELRELYTGHEIACHTLQHGYMERMPGVSLVHETMQDRLALEKTAGCPVVGMSYPCGSVNELTLKALEVCGVAYCRTTNADHRMHLPKEPLLWDPTCHHKDAMPLAERFMEMLESYWCGPLLYIWGHSHEFKTEEDWQYMERLVQMLAGDGRIWYATNIEICDYMTAQRLLRVSADEKMLTNPTATDVWVEKDKREIVHIPAGKTVRLP